VLPHEARFFDPPPEHGSACLLHAWRGDVGNRFREVVEGVFQDISAELARFIDGWSPAFRADTFIACLSKHDSKEDDLGRLSMWRAYGGSAGVAVILNAGVFLSVNDALTAFTSPVAYLSRETFVDEFERVTANVLANVDFLCELGRQDFFNSLFHAFRLATLCTKHPGFAEEREWRIVCAPSFGKSERIVPSVELIRGVPQIVHSIPFKDYPEEGLVGAELPALIHRVIIGPTEFPAQLRLAMVSLLNDAGVADPESKGRLLHDPAAAIEGTWRRSRTKDIASWSDRSANRTARIEFTPTGCLRGHPAGV
jgi:hypothetical protein